MSLVFVLLADLKITLFLFSLMRSECILRDTFGSVNGLLYPTGPIRNYSLVVISFRLVCQPAREKYRTPLQNYPSLLVIERTQRWG